VKRYTDETLSVSRNIFSVWSKEEKREDITTAREEGLRQMGVQKLVTENWDLWSHVREFRFNILGILRDPCFGVVWSHFNKI